MSMKMKMMLLGPSGVGKTSFLATMWDEFFKSETAFDVKADANTSRVIQNCLSDLKSVEQQKGFAPIEALLEGTKQPTVKYLFEVRHGNEKELDIIFIDHRGGLVNAGESEEGRHEFVAELKDAHVIMNVIDGAVMVAGDDALSQKYNNHFAVQNLLTDALSDDRKHLVLFVITKCEKWLTNEHDRSKLLGRFEEHHKGVLNLIQRKDNTAALLMPVKTLGCVEFSRIETKNGNPYFIFTKNFDKPFRPEGVMQPLRYALAFALNVRDENRSLWSYIWRVFTGREASFQKAFHKFSKEKDKTFKRYGSATILNEMDQ